MKKVLMIVQIVALSFLLVCTVLFFVSMGSIGIKGMFSLTHNKPEISTVVLQHSLEDVAEMATAKYESTRMEKREDCINFFSIDGWTIPFTQNRMILTYDVTVSAGLLDFSDVELKIDEKKEIIRVILPHAGIIGSASINHDSVKIYDIEKSIFNPIPDDAQLKMLKDGEEQAIQEAIDDGILKRADNNLMNLITSMLETMTAGSAYEDYYIDFDWR